MRPIGTAASTILCPCSCSLLLLACFATTAFAGEAPSIEERVVLREWLLLPKVGHGGRTAFPRDPVTQALVNGTYGPPSEGDVLPLEPGRQAVWTRVNGPQEGPLSHELLLGGWAYANVHVHAAEARRAILRAKGHSIVYVNGEPRVTNVYRYGYPMIPVLLDEGDNHLLFRCTRFGTLEAWLEPVTHDVMVNMEDATLPEAVRGEGGALDAGILVLNTTTEILDLADAQGTVDRGDPTLVALPSVRMPPLSIAKVPVLLPAREVEGESIAWRITGERIQPATVEVPVVEPGAYRKVTFRSQVEGSVQYFGYRPPRAPRNESRHALMLHLHGASDEASTYRDLYFAKTWCAMASATNRRPYGFNWESLGRIDAMEVLDRAIAYGNTDPTRIYLGGHSMGGHGVWQIAGHHPDRFAAIGPGAGWQDVWTYAGARRMPEDGVAIQRILRVSANPSRTALLAGNYLQHGVLIIHGDADPVVSIDEAYGMQKILEDAGHHDVTLVIEPGGPHVYDTTPEVGHSCFDLRELFDFFQRHAIPVAPQRIDFTTVGPGINDTCSWLGVQQQVRQWEPSRVRLQLDPGRRVLHGVLENVQRFSVNPAVLLESGEITARLDGGKALKIDWAAGHVHFTRTEDGWLVAPQPDLAQKGPHRSGPFKDVFHRNHPILVIGTGGSKEENAWSRAKARFDNETLWYRGNASFEIVTDTEFDPAAEPDRNVILYGNRDTNRAWSAVLGTSPVDVARGEIRVGEKTFEGANLSALAVRPRPGSDVACVGLVGGTGITGMRATNELGFFHGGVHFPDFVVFSARVWSVSEEAVLAAGFFDNDWGLDDAQTGYAE